MNEKSIKITLRGSTERIPASDPTAVILDSAISAGLNPPFACQSGSCGACRCKLFTGEVDPGEPFALTDEEIKDGYILACQAIPKSDEISVDFDA